MLSSKLVCSFALDMPTLLPKKRHFVSKNMQKVRFLIQSGNLSDKLLTEDPSSVYPDVWPASCGMTGMLGSPASQ